MPVLFDNRLRSMSSDARCRSWFVWRMPTERNRITSSSEIPLRYSSVRYTLHRIVASYNSANPAHQKEQTHPDPEPDADPRRDFRGAVWPEYRIRDRDRAAG